MSTREQNLQFRYGISLDEYNYLYDLQNGRCAICRRPETMIRGGKLVPLFVDHDHRTGRVRGLLCFKCNTVLGHLEDDARMLLAIQYYLERNRYDIALRIAA